MFSGSFQDYFILCLINEVLSGQHTLMAEAQIHWRAAFQVMHEKRSFTTLKLGRIEQAMKRRYVL